MKVKWYQYMRQNSKNKNASNGEKTKSKRKLAILIEWDANKSVTRLWTLLKIILEFKSKPYKIADYICDILLPNYEL